MSDVLAAANEDVRSHILEALKDPEARRAVGDRSSCLPPPPPPPPPPSPNKTFLIILIVGIVVAFVMICAFGIVCAYFLWRRSSQSHVHHDPVTPLPSPQPQKHFEMADGPSDYAAKGKFAVAESSLADEAWRERDSRRHNPQTMDHAYERTPLTVFVPDLD